MTERSDLDLAAAQNSDTQQEAWSKFFGVTQRSGMSEPFFFHRGNGLTVREIAALTGAEMAPQADADRRITGVSTLDRAVPDELVFLDKVKYAPELAITSAGACLTRKQLAEHAPGNVSMLYVREPYRAYVEVTQKLFPDALRPSSLFGTSDLAVGAHIHSSARLEKGAVVDPGVIVGPQAEIGARTIIAAGAVIGPRVRIGRDCAIGASACITNALIGDRVVIHAGCAVGQDGFGYLRSGGIHRKVLQIGRVIIQNDVEIGAGTTIDRGANRDTVVGEGTKIDNQVQIGHNVVIGRHCIIVSQCGISGSVVIGDRAVLAGQVGLADNISIGEGAIIGAQSGIMCDVPAGERWFGYPATRAREYFRGVTKLRELVRGGSAHDKDDRSDSGARESPEQEPG
jgi:UDP-3-O-[3-hydroxymyristoyl] glucosamine N-acyltransferase